MSATLTKTIHKFEAAGLGLAPFYFVRHERQTFQACHGAPIQPGTSCDYCGTGICEVFYCRSTDGREFKVGSDCIEKVGDAGLKRAVNKIKTEASHVRDDARIEAAMATALLPAVQNELRQMLGTFGRRAWQQVESAFEPHSWCGRAGKIRAARLVEQAAKKVGA